MALAVDAERKFQSLTLSWYLFSPLTVLNGLCSGGVTGVVCFSNQDIRSKDDYVRRSGSVLQPFSL